MSKKIIIIILGVLILLAIGVVIFASRQQKEGFVSSILEAGKPKQSGKNLTYEDEAGFSFQYPSTLGVIEKDVNDPLVYSSLELSSKDHPGEKLVFKITDTSLTAIDKWLEKNPQTGNLANSAEIALGDMSGKNLKYTNPSRNLILAVDNGILYLIQAPEDQGFWTQAFKMVSESFQLTNEKSAAGGGGVSIIDEGEEIIE